MNELPKEFVIYDTEYTAWEGSMARGWTGHGEERELVQLGAIKVRDLEEVDSLLLYVRPVFNPELSDYFTKLTGITQADIEERGSTFTLAYTQFRNWVDGWPCYAYGLDHEVLQRNHDLLETGQRLSRKQFFDIREYFQAAGIDTEAYMSSTLPEAFGLTPPPHGHDALNDARSILMALKAVYTRQQ